MEMTTAKTLAVFAIIFGCFAVLYPKIFHPMILNMFGGQPERTPSEDLLNRVPPHLRRPGAGARGVPPGGGDDFAQHMRPGPHPGLRAAAEMKKQAGATQGGSGKGMMAIVLPMYAVGIVIYLIYTMTKVFGKGKKEDEKDYMASHFNNPQQQQEQQEGSRGRPRRPRVEESEEEDEGEEEEEREGKHSKQRQKDLERLLMKADKDKISRPSRKTKKSGGDFGLGSFLARKDADISNITDYEMQQLKRRLLETEAQMTRILAAMDTVTDKVASMPDEMMENIARTAKGSSPSDEASTPDGFTKLPDSSPDMDSYEFVGKKSQRSAGGAEEEESTGEEVEDIRAAEVKAKGARRRKKVKEVEEVQEEDESDKENQERNDRGYQEEQSEEDEDEDEDGVEYGDDDIMEGLSEEEEVEESEGEQDNHQEVILQDNDSAEEEEQEKEHPDLRKRKPAKHKARKDD